jgi:hypothetical protein
MPSNERRHTKRVQQLLVKAYGRIYPIGVPAVVVNLSETGMGIRTSLPLPVPSRHQFDIVFETEPPVRVIGDIVHCEIDDDEMHYTIGVRFVQPTDVLERVAKSCGA